LKTKKKERKKKKKEFFLDKSFGSLIGAMIRSFVCSAKKNFARRSKVRLGLRSISPHPILKGKKSKLKKFLCDMQ
jgi:hypothetical protein